MPDHQSVQDAKRRRQAMPNEVEREWLSVKELGVLTGLGRTKLYEVVASGELEAIKVGRAVRVSRTAFEEWTRKNLYSDGRRG